MKFFLLIVISSFSILSFSQPSETIKTDSTVIYHGRQHFLIEGTAISDSLKESPYDRLPISYKEKVREPVWDLSKASAGITVRFHSNSTSINLKWTVLNDLDMSHMAATGIKGIDLYTKYNNKWRYVTTAGALVGLKTYQNKSIPADSINEYELIKNMTPEFREYKLFLPLYDGVTKLEVGIDSAASIEKATPSSEKPIVFYGTSITQGGCASRPGMAHTNIISRKLDVDCINYGFSGNGRMETPIVELISEIDARFYVIECLQNMDSEQVKERVKPLVDIIRTNHPHTPIVLVENMMYTMAFLNQTLETRLIEENTALKNEYDKIIKSGTQNIFYIKDNKEFLVDNEGTVDGVHLTDLGFKRYADYLIENFKKFKFIKD
ncbi:SGNH/GDSL hydrolase family protein [Flavobacteriaceae bacterium]|nr:SGNH/GDSL hydrolase family protein [Flavobacteriaceae bacterium]MDA8904523.1 SGNH/GDSL hydrolase family protein [Flavobacteriaceae bacterium]MDA9067564.1 SGNH/GDSL hydrolase family protein [Flavobacteriaceae bacterium]MDB4134787.1 SGNH/GDSL hydrolase family protein [Flavobacteriaceae bacterium]MDB4213138.1 SGNH/GDSL hydrolase family protein [Flavobacteriaceae bacterium]